MFNCSPGELADQAVREWVIESGEVVGQVKIKVGST